jgi:hypothetical protein
MVGVIVGSSVGVSVNVIDGIWVWETSDGVDRIVDVGGKVGLDVRLSVVQE